MTTQATETLLSGREVAKAAGVTIKTLVRHVIAGRVRPDFSTTHHRLLFRPETVARVCQTLSK